MNEYEEFVEFVADNEPELRYTASRAVGDAAAADLLMRRALATVARRWRLLHGRDRQRALLEAVESEANTLWHAENPDSDPAAATAADTPSALAAEAWTAGRRQRRRRILRFALAATVAAALLAGYAWSANREPIPDPLPQHVAGQVTSLDEVLAVLPPQETLEASPQLRDHLPDVLDAAETSSLTEDPVDAVAVAFATADDDLAVLGDDGAVRIVDDVDPAPNRLFPRAISPQADRLALPQPSGMAVVSASGDVTWLDLADDGLPDDPDAVTDVAWFPDDEHLMVTFGHESHRVHAESGQSEAMGWHGPSTTFHPAEDYPVEFVSGAHTPLSLQAWHDAQPHGQAQPAEADALPVRHWRGVPDRALGSDFYAYACELDDSPIPADYGTARQCVAAIDEDATVTALLAIPGADAAPAAESVLGIAAGKVIFTVPAQTDDRHLMLAWRPDDGALETVTAFDGPPAAAIGAF